MESKMINFDGHIIPYEGPEPDNGFKINNSLFIEVHNRAERAYITFMVDDYDFRTSDKITNSRDFPFAIEVNPEGFIKKHTTLICEKVFNFDNAHKMIESYCDYHSKANVCGYELTFKENSVTFYPAEDCFNINILKSCFEFINNNYTVQTVTISHKSDVEYEFNQAELHKILEEYKKRC